MHPKRRHGDGGGWSHCDADRRRLVGLLEPNAGCLMSEIPPPRRDIIHELIGMRLFDLIFGASVGIVRGLVVKNLSWAQRIASTIVGALTAGSVGPTANAIAMRWLEW